VKCDEVKCDGKLKQGQQQRRMQKRNSILNCWDGENAQMNVAGDFVFGPRSMLSKTHPSMMGLLLLLVVPAAAICGRVQGVFCNGGNCAAGSCQCPSHLVGPNWSVIAPPFLFLRSIRAFVKALASTQTDVFASMLLDIQQRIQVPRTSHCALQHERHVQLRRQS
jgi:hypothetical protein